MMPSNNIWGGGFSAPQNPFMKWITDKAGGFINNKIKPQVFNPGGSILKNLGVTPMNGMAGSESQGFSFGGETPSPSFMTSLKQPGFGGLLSDEESSFANTQGLLGAAANMLSMSGPSTTPTSFGQALGSGLQGYTQGKQNAFENTMNAKMMQLRMRPEETEIAKNARAAGYVPGTPEYQQFIKDYISRSRGDYFQFLPTSNGYMVGDTRRGTIASPTVNGKAGVVTPAQFDPNLQRTLAGSKAVGEIEGQVSGDANVKKPQQAKNVLSMLDEADSLIDKSTGSAIGTGVDKAAGAFGVSTPGADANAKLKVIQAGLMSSMPRMEGPQSDKDVELYREQAAKIGDPMTPNAQKKAAAAMLRTLQQKYADRANTGQPASVVPAGKSKHSGAWN